MAWRLPGPGVWIDSIGKKVIPLLPRLAWNPKTTGFSEEHVLPQVNDLRFYDVLC